MFNLFKGVRICLIKINIWEGVEKQKMENVDDLVMDAVLADSRFDGLGFSESEIEL